MNGLPMLHIPVEVKARELKSRLFFAGKAIERGFIVALGASRELHANLDCFPPGVIVENDVTVASAKFMALARRLGFRVIAWDEEAIAVLNDSWYARQRVSVETLRSVDMFFTRGGGDLKAIAALHPSEKHKLVPAGNPRLDILSPGVVELRRPDSVKHGRILVMSRFSRSNPFSITRDQALANAKRKFMLDPEAGRFYENYLLHCHDIFDRFFPMVGRLADRFPGNEIVLRPHPSENYETWRELSSKHANLRVDASGTAEEWATTSSVVIHNGCTTGLEAALLGCTVLSYMPISSDIYDVPLPNLMSEICTDEEVLFKTVEKIISAPSNVQVMATNAWRMIRSGWIGDSSGRFATEIMVDGLEAYYSTGNHGPSRRYISTMREKSVRLYRLFRKARTFPDKRPSTLSEAYRKQKLDMLTREEIRDQLGLLGFHGLTVTPFKCGWWLIHN